MRKPRVSNALRQIGRDTVSPSTYDSAMFAADQAHFERRRQLNPAPTARHPRLERVAPGQQRRIVHIRPSMVKAHRQS